MNEITEVKLTLANDDWKIEVTKEFSPEYGGGSQVFTRSGGRQIHEALRRAAEMVTLTPAYNAGKQPDHIPLSGGRSVWADPAHRCDECGKPFRGGRYCDECTAKFKADPPQFHDYDSEGNPRRGIL